MGRDIYDKECILPKYVLVGRGDFGPRVLAANDKINELRQTKKRAGWEDHPNIRIYEFKE
jgi:hypothetical protein